MTIATPARHAENVDESFSEDHAKWPVRLPGQEGMYWWVPLYGFLGIQTYFIPLFTFLFMFLYGAYLVLDLAVHWV